MTAEGKKNWEKLNARNQENIDKMVEEAIRQSKEDGSYDRFMPEDGKIMKVSDPRLLADDIEKKMIEDIAQRMEERDPLAWFVASREVLEEKPSLLTEKQLGKFITEIKNTDWE